jgi:hypothetical protein
LFKIVNTDNFGGDYPDEAVLGTMDADGKFRPKLVSARRAKDIADVLNLENIGDCAPRYWAVRTDDYELRGPFEP